MSDSWREELEQEKNRLRKLYPYWTENKIHFIAINLLQGGRNDEEYH